MLLNYEPDNGALIWKERPRTRFRDSGSWNRFNKFYAGQRALDYSDREGYKHGPIFRRDYRAHRVAWAIHHGQWPTLSLDHINGDPADNRLANLREVTGQDNQLNLKLRHDNKSGHSGVRFCHVHRKWQARIGYQGKKFHLGSFDDFAAACAARVAAELRLGFHENHGRQHKSGKV